MLKCMRISIKLLFEISKNINEYNTNHSCIQSLSIQTDTGKSESGHKN